MLQNVIVPKLFPVLGISDKPWVYGLGFNMFNGRGFNMFNTGNGLVNAGEVVIVLGCSVRDRDNIYSIALQNGHVVRASFYDITYYIKFV